MTLDVFFHGYSNQPALQSLNDCVIFFLGLQIEISRFWGLVIYNWNGSFKHYSVLHATKNYYYNLKTKNKIL